MSRFSSGANFSRTDQIRRHLEEDVWDEEDEECYIVIIVVHVKVCFKALNPCIADVGP